MKVVSHYILHNYCLHAFVNQCTSTEGVPIDMCVRPQTPTHITSEK